jgi:hypothetical protein
MARRPTILPLGSIGRIKEDHAVVLSPTELRPGPGWKLEARPPPMALSNGSSSSRLTRLKNDRKSRGEAGAQMGSGRAYGGCLSQKREGRTD